MGSNKKRITKIILINIAIYLFVIIALELVFGKWINKDPLNNLNVIRSQKFKIDIRSLYDYPDPYITYTRDRYGLRGSFSDPEEIDILTMGGSTVNLIYINDGETWQDVIQDNFKEIGKKVVIANGGTEGANVTTMINQIESWISTIPELKPNYILYYIGLNDMYLRAYMPRYQPPWVKNFKRKTLSSYIYENSAIYHLFYSLYNGYASPYILDTYKTFDFSDYQWTTTPLQNSYGEVLEEHLIEYKELLNKLVDRTLELGATPIFVTQVASCYRLRDGKVEGMKIYLQYDDMYTNGLDYFNIIMMYNEVTMSICEERRAICLDSAKDIEWSQEDFLDLQHTSLSSMTKFGNYLFHELNELY